MQKRKVAALVSNLVLALGIAVATPTALAAVPSTLNYQGQLGNAAGAQVNGAVSITFALYDVATGGTAVWSETQSVTVNNGLYYVTLGQTTALTPSLFGVPLFLGIKVGTDAEMTPRTPLNSSATALRAQVAESLNCTNCVTATQIAGSAIASAIPAGSITAAQIAPGVIPTTTGGGVPVGTLIMSMSATPPAGFSYVGSGPSGETWTHRAYMPTARTNVSVAVVNNKLYAIGGMVRVNAFDSAGLAITSPTPPFLASVYDFYVSANEVYDPASNTWTTKAPLPTLRNTFAAAAIGGKIYAVGGQIMTTAPVLPPTVTTPVNGVYADTAINEEYDPVADTWTTKTPMPTARRYVSAGVINNKLYVLGGRGPNGAGGVRTIYANNEEYDPAANAWVTKAPMPTARRALSVAVVNGKLYAMGGRVDNLIAPNYATLNNENEEYDPVANTWTTRAPMPEFRTGFAAGTINGKIYAVGGWGTFNGIKLATSAEYDPVTDRWTARADMPMHYSGLANSGGVINNKLYAVGGDDADTNGLIQLFRYCQEYDPGTPLFMHVKQ